MLKIVLYCSIFVCCACFISCRNNEQPRGQAATGEPGRQLIIQPFQEADTSSIALLKLQLPEVYNISVTVMPRKSIPANAWYPERRRYWADSILKFLQPFAKNNETYVLGVTGKDISTKKANYPNWGVMGLGFMPGKCCVISDYRMQSILRTKQQTDTNLLKVAIHELGHNFGLPHCPEKTCFMADAEGKNNSDREYHFCGNCRAYLEKQHILKKNGL